MVIIVLSALLSFGVVAFAGVQIDPDGRPHAAGTSTGDKGWGLDPNGSPSRAAATDQGSMIDPDGKPSR